MVTDINQRTEGADVCAIEAIPPDAPVVLNVQNRRHGGVEGQKPRRAKRNQAEVSCAAMR